MCGARTAALVLVVIAKLRNHQRGLTASRLSLIDKFDGNRGDLSRDRSTIFLTVTTIHGKFITIAKFQEIRGESRRHRQLAESLFA